MENLQNTHTSAVVASDGTKLSYRVIGDGPLTVLLIHGWMVSGAIFNELVSALGTEGLRLIVPDLRGTGGSDRPDGGYTIEQYGLDVMAVADAAGARSFVVVGHSMGGQIAQWLAATSPERVLGAVLLCSVPASGAPLPPEVRALFQSSGGDRAKQGGIVSNVCKDISPEAKERLLDDAATIPATCIEQAFRAWADASFAEKLGAIKAPTLVVTTDDPALPSEFLKQTIAAVIPGAGFAYLPGPGHYLPVERPREAAAIVRAFLAALRP